MKSKITNEFWTIVVFLALNYYSTIQYPGAKPTPPFYSPVMTVPMELCATMKFFPMPEEIGKLFQI